MSFRVSYKARNLQASWVTVEWRESAGVVNVDVIEMPASFHPERKALCYSEKLIINQNTRRHTPNDRILLSHCPLTPAFASYHTSTCRSWPCRAGPTAVARPGPLLPHFTLISPALSRCSETETVRPACQQFSQWHCQCRFSSLTQKLYPSLSKAFALPSWYSSCQMNLCLNLKRMPRNRNSSVGVVTG